MSTSGSSDFTMSGQQIVEKAFQLLGVGQEGEALTARQTADGMLSLNLLIKTWNAKPHLWTKASQSIALVEGQAAYTTSPRAMRLLGVRRRTTASGVDVPLNELSRQEYDETPNKSSKGTPTAFYFDPQRMAATLYVWQTASAQVASTTTLQVTYLRRMDDIDASNNEADIPQEWHQALVWGLAADLMPEYPVESNLAQLIITRAQMLFADLSGWDNEPASYFLQPAWNS